MRTLLSSADGNLARRGVIPSAAAAVVAAACAVGCRGDAPPPPGGPAATVAARADPPYPLAKAVSADGRWTLALDLVLRVASGDGGAPPTLQVQARLSSDDPDVLLAGSPTLRVRTLGGAVRDAPHGLAEPGERRATFHGVPFPEDDDRVAALEIGCRVVGVRTWRTYDFAGLGTSLRTAVAPPYELRFVGEPDFVRAGGHLQDVAHGTPERRIADPLSFRWALGALELTDAAGRGLTLGGVAGSGGNAAGLYGHGAPVAYPVSARLRVPEAYDVEDAVFRFGETPVFRP